MDWGILPRQLACEELYDTSQVNVFCWLRIDKIEGIQRIVLLDSNI